MLNKMLNISALFRTKNVKEKEESLTEKMKDFNKSFNSEDSNKNQIKTKIKLFIDS